MAATAAATAASAADQAQIWECRVCKCKSALQAHHRTSHEIVLDQPAPYILKLRWTVCPNLACREVSLVLKLFSAKADSAQGQIQRVKQIKHWPLLPASKPVPLPDCLPAHIAQDFQEAFAIKVLSPKASATLSRRCLQALIRDVWKVKPGRLVDELNQIKDRMRPGLWEAINAVRKVGNVAAHLAEDASRMVEVHPKEAQSLLDLLEALFNDWYNHRGRLQNLVLLAEKKTNGSSRAPRPIN